MPDQNPLPKYPEDFSLVSETEQFVQHAAQAYADDVNSLRQAVLGRSGRPYRHLELTPEERGSLYQELRQNDDPEGWGKLLDGGNPGTILKWWKEQEARYRAGGASLPIQGNTNA